MEALCESSVWKTPKGVLIDQSVVTAKNYGEQNSYKFVNAVLDKVLA